MTDFQDKVVFITGAGRGRGREIALAFARQGAIVAVNDITPINLDETVNSIRRTGGRVSDYIFDVAKKMPVQAMVEAVLDDWGKIDILINNAQVEPHASILNMDEWDWRRTLDVNLSGPFFTMQSVGRIMRTQGGGVIVNVIFRPAYDEMLPDRAAFNASKAALVALTRDAAREFAAFNVRVNAVCPGFPEIGRTDGDADLNNLRMETIMDGKWDGDPVAEAVLFLCSKAAHDLSGRTISITGDIPS